MTGVALVRALRPFDRSVDGKQPLCRAPEIGDRLAPDRKRPLNRRGKGRQGERRAAFLRFVREQLLDRERARVRIGAVVDQQPELAIESGLEVEAMDPLRRGLEE